MTLQTEERDTTGTPEQSVSDYLARHPDFFERHPELLVNLELPHPRGQAVSLVERQMQALRGEVARHREQLAELIAVARENEQLNARLHRLTLTLIAAANFDEVINALEDKLHDDFRAEAVEIHLFSQAETERANDPEIPKWPAAQQAPQPGGGMSIRERLAAARGGITNGQQRENGGG